MKQKLYRVSATMWFWPAKTSGWHFLTIPKKESKEIKEAYKNLSKGFGSLPVEVTIGKTIWQTSIFPDTKGGTYLLPVKAQVRRAEDIHIDEKINFSFKIKPK